MNHAVTAVCQSKEQLRNVEDELRSSGVPSENIFVDESACQIKIMIAEATKPGVIEMIERHGATAKS